MKARLLIGAVALLSCGPSPDAGQPQQRPAGGAVRVTEAEVEEATADFQELRESFLEAYLEWRPVRATELGVHDHDDRMPAMDRRGTQRRIDQVLGWLGELEAIPPAHLAGEDRTDYAVLEYGLRSELLELEETRSWTRDPRLYTETIARGIAAVAEREYAPLRDRVASIVARMDASHDALAAARTNLSAPPLVWTELAVEETRGLIDFLAQDLGAVLAVQGAEQGGAAVDLEALTESRDRLIASLNEHLEWLESSLLPESNGDFRLGRYLFERKLLYEEHISLSVAQLDQLNERAIGEHQERVTRVAAEIDAGRTPGAILDSLGRERPEPGALLDAARQMTVDAREWVDRSGVVPLLTTDRPTVRETPSYVRADLASLDAPGPFEAGAREAFYNVPVSLDYTALRNVTLHETYPGRYVQAAYAREVDSEIRRVFLSRSFVGGWAHYAEQMALDEGYGGDDPTLRLAQLRRALERHARWYAALHLHAFDTPLEQIVERFMEIAHLDEAQARREVIRGTHDPTYLSEALGRMQIVDIRNDYRERQEAQGGTFSLSEFHAQLLMLGLPLPLAREEMLPLSDEGEQPGRSPAGPRPASTAGQ